MWLKHEFIDRLTCYGGGGGAGEGGGGVEGGDTDGDSWAGWGDGMEAGSVGDSASAAYAASAADAAAAAAAPGGDAWAGDAYGNTGAPGGDPAAGSDPAGTGFEMGPGDLAGLPGVDAGPGEPGGVAAGPGAGAVAGPSGVAESGDVYAGIGFDAANTSPGFAMSPGDLAAYTGFQEGPGPAAVAAPGVADATFDPWTSSAPTLSPAGRVGDTFDELSIQGPLDQRDLTVPAPALPSAPEEEIINDPMFQQNTSLAPTDNVMQANPDIVSDIQDPAQVSVQGKNMETFASPFSSAFTQSAPANQPSGPLAAWSIDTTGMDPVTAAAPAAAPAAWGDVDEATQAGATVDTNGIFSSPEFADVEAPAAPAAPGFSFANPSSVDIATPGAYPAQAQSAYAPTSGLMDYFYGQPTALSPAYTDPAAPAPSDPAMTSPAFDPAVAPAAPPAPAPGPTAIDSVNDRFGEFAPPTAAPIEFGPEPIATPASLPEADTNIPGADLPAPGGSFSSIGGLTGGGIIGGTAAGANSVSTSAVSASPAAPGETAAPGPAPGASPTSPAAPAAQGDPLSDPYTDPPSPAMDKGPPESLVASTDALGSLANFGPGNSSYGSPAPPSTPAGGNSAATVTPAAPNLTTPPAATIPTIPLELQSSLDSFGFNMQAWIRDNPELAKSLGWV